MLGPARRGAADGRPPSKRRRSERSRTERAGSRPLTSLAEMLELAESEARPGDCSATCQGARRASSRRSRELDLKSVLSGRVRPSRRAGLDPSGAGGDRVAGLGADAAAHVPALGRAPRVRARACSTSSPGTRRASRTRRSRSAASTPTATSRPRAACTGWCGSRPTTRPSDATPRSPRCSCIPMVDETITVDISSQRPARRHLPRQRRGRPARQQDGVGRAHHPHRRPASWCNRRPSAASTGTASSRCASSARGCSSTSRSWSA